MTLLIVAWRNIWRNGRRTAITVAAVSLSTAILIAVFALMEGMLKDLEDSVTEGHVGHAQVHADKYLDDRSIYESIESSEAILDAVRKAGFDAAPRSFGFGLIAAGAKSAGASFWGVDPSAEKKAFRLPGQIAAGRFLDNGAKGEVVIGGKLAKSLNIGLGGEVVAVVQAADGSLGNELFKIKGILKSAGEELDRSGVLLHGDDFERLFLTAGRVHEIAVNTHGKVPLDRIAPAIGPVSNGSTLKTWRQIIPAFAHMMDVSDASTWFFALVFYLAAAVGVMNTMLMATHDRVRELGVAKALGATPWRIAREVAAEGWMLSIVSTLIGSVLGVACAFYLKVFGIDFSSAGEMTAAGMAYPMVWHGDLTVSDFFTCVVTMWVICVLASLYPAVKAARLQAVEAMTDV